MILTAEEVIELIPQKPPFRFLDRLLSIDETTAVGEYTFRPDEWFYAGHFPGHPVTPGVILLETMCQTGLVAMGIYLLGLEAPREQVARTVTLFTDSQVEFERVLLPGATVRVQAERVGSKTLQSRPDGDVIVWQRPNKPVGDIVRHYHRL